MYCAFGVHGLAGFFTVQLVSHLIASLVVLAFLTTLFSRRIGLAATSVFVLGVPQTLALPSATDALWSWIDCVEPWITCAMLGSLWLFLRYLCTNRRSYFAASIAVLVIALGIKELAYVAPLIVVWCLAIRGRLRDWKLAVPYAAVCAAALVYRTIVFHGRGAHYGSNGTWVQRLAEWFGGLPAAQAVNHNLDAFVLVAFPFAVWAVVHAVRVRTGASVLMAAAALIVATFLNYGDARLAGVGAAINAFRFFVTGRGELMPEPVASSMPIIGILWLWYCILRLRNPLAIAGIVFAAIAYLPLLTAPILAHALYLCSVGWALVIVASLGELIRRASRIAYHPSAGNRASPV
jgi:hypothetical protein